MSFRILTTKLYIPPPPKNLVHRSRLIEILNQGLDKKLTVISAPAGFGKTTLLSECVAQCNRSVAWYSLDESDDDLERFLPYLVAALQTVYPDIDVTKSIHTETSQSYISEIILSELINQIDQSSEQAVLVLDDYHVLESLEIDQAISFLISNMPPRLHLVIATRTDPAFPLSRLRSQGQLTEIRVDDLRFTPKEADTFLIKRMGIKISSEDITSLESRTEGWIAGLQMVALSIQRLKEKNEISRFVRNFSSSHRYILDYLTDEVLLQRPSGTKDFLLQTSILDRLRHSLCNAVLGITNSQEILESLETANLFLVPLDNERIWYRYHHLFGDLLKNRLKRTTPHLIPDLHRRASAWYADNDSLSEAINHSLAAKDYKQASQLTENTFFDRMGHGEDFSTMLARLVALPGEIINARPFLSIMYAWMLSITLQLDQVEPRLVDIETRFGDQLSSDLERQIAAIRAEVLRHQGEYKSSIKATLNILKSLPEEKTFADYQTYTGLATNLAWGYILAGDLDRAQMWFDKAMAVSQHSITLTLVTMFGLAWIQEMGGGLQAAIDICNHGLQLAEEASKNFNTRVSSIVYMYLRLGSILRERNQLEEADHYLTLGLELGQKWNFNKDTMKDGYLELAKLRLSQRDFPGAMVVLEQTEKRLSRYLHIKVFGDLIKAHKARVRLAWDASTRNSRHLKQVEDWSVGRNRFIDRSVDSIHDEFESLVWVRLLVAQNQSETALRVLEPLIVNAAEKKRVARVIEMHILKALAYHSAGEIEKMLAALESAFVLAETGGYIRLFVDEGPQMEELLRQAARNGIARNYVDMLLDAYRTHRALVSSKPILSKSQSRLVEPLSGREIEVLYLMSGGATNQEIALDLVIAVTTAKKHVSNIIGKLGVNNRTQAVAKAKELHLI